MSKGSILGLPLSGIFINDLFNLSTALSFTFSADCSPSYASKCDVKCTSDTADLEIMDERLCLVVKCYTKDTLNI